MKKMLWITAILLPLAFAATAQKERTLKKVLQLVITEPNGANGANVAWHPILKKYYAAIAGNAEYPLCVFDATGKRLSKPGLQTMADLRGLWYNPLLKTLQANAYADGGLVQYKLDTKGLPLSVATLDLVTGKPDDQSTATFNPALQQIYFYRYGDVDAYSMKDGALLSSQQLHLSYISEDDENNGLFENDDLLDIYNAVSMVYTGIKGSEFGLLNFDERLIELYDMHTGYMTQKLALPPDAPVNERLNFSFTNGIFWLFDKDSRTWVGYK